MTQPSSSVNERILRHNEELTNFVARSSEEKNELRNALSRLEEEIWQYRRKDAKYQVNRRKLTLKVLSKTVADRIVFYFKYFFPRK